MSRRRTPVRAASVVASVITLVVAVVLLEPVRVTAASMQPTYAAGDILVVEKLSVRLGVLRHGDVVVLRAPGGPGLLVKRVVGLPHDRVSLRDGLLHVNGQAVREPFPRPETMDGVEFGPAVVPAGALFVLGDNRAASIDSRDFGPVSWDRLVGTVLWPGG